MTASETRSRAFLMRCLHNLLWFVAGGVATFGALFAYGSHQHHEQLVADAECQSDLAAARKMIQEALASYDLDQDAITAFTQKHILAMQAACVRHDEYTARAVGMQLAFDLALATDGVKKKPQTSTVPPKGPPESPRSGR